MASTVLPNGIIIPEKYSRDWYADLYHNWQELDNLLAGGGANDGTLTIQKNGTTVGTFSANQATNETVNISVPTATSELTNDSGYLTSSSNLDASKLTSGTVDIARLPQGALERLVKVADEAARYALTTADVQLGDTVQQLDTGIMYVVTDTDHLDSAAGYTEYTAGTAASVPWSGVTGKPTIPTVNDATLTIQQNGTTVDTFTANSSTDKTVNIQCVDLSNNQTVGGNKEFTGTTTAHDVIPATADTYDLGSSSTQWNNAYIKSLTINGVACGDILTHNASEFVPRSGGGVLSGLSLGRINNIGSILLTGGKTYDDGAYIQCRGKYNQTDAGYITLATNGSFYNVMILQPDGTWTWSGSACVVGSDRRIKDEIESIPDEILDAWENLEPKQYKLKSDLETDKDNAQIHYGWIAQEVESAIKGERKAEVKNGLFLHETWEEQQEVSHEETYTEEVETKSGEKQTVTKTRKVIDQPYKAKGDSYGLRYAECLVVECKYLRRCIARLTARIEELEKGNKEAEK